HLGAIDNGIHACFPEMCVSQPNGLGGCPTAGYGAWSEGYYTQCTGYGLVTILQDSYRLILQTVDQFGNVQISYTVWLTPSADLSITATDGKTTIIAGSNDTYRIVVSNVGPSDVTGAVVSDSFPSTFIGVTFTATESGGASGFTPSRSGNINDTQTIPTAH